MRRISKRAGFSVVELLIVIVVIAIIAAISVGAYNGVIQQSNNIARIANAQHAMELLKLYTAKYGQYPTNASSCIGNGFAANNTLCWGIDSATPMTRKANFNDVELIKVGTLPNNTTLPVQTTNWKGLGPVYMYDNNYMLDGSSHLAFMLYFLEGYQQSCSMTPIVRETSSDNFTTYTGIPSYSSSWDNYTSCIVPIYRSHPS